MFFFQKILKNLYKNYNFDYFSAGNKEKSFIITKYYEEKAKKYSKNETENNIIIPIILFLPKDYEYIIYTTIISALENANKNSFYAFYLIVPSDFSKNIENQFLKINKIYKCDLYIIFVQSKFENLINKISNSSFPNYYHFLIGELIPKEINKCIYLGSDICVNKDLSGLFNIDIENNYLAGVVSFEEYFLEKKYRKKLNISSMKTYVNLDVLILNLKEIRKDNMTQKFIDLSKRNINFHTQDIINLACYGRIITLPLKYNVMTSKVKMDNPHLNELYKEEEIIDAKISPYIVHYSDKKKPWNGIQIYMEKYWWNIAKKTPFINLFSRENIYKIKIKQFWYKHFKKKLDFYRLRTFNEKIQWLKLYDSTPIKTILTDKYLVRSWIKEKIGEEYLIPLLGVYDNFEEINFKKLPNQFVIKCNHGSGYNIIVKNNSQLNMAKIKSKINTWMNQNYAFTSGLELHYRDIKPKIIIEQYMDDNTGDLRDYKVICFNGKPYFLWIDCNRHLNHKRNLYDLNWNQLPYKVNTKYSTFPSPKKPKSLDKMKDLAIILSKNFAFVRVDFYIINDKIYFGEMTFTSSSGTESISPKIFERRLSSLLVLPELAYNIDTGVYYKWKKNNI